MDPLHVSNPLFNPVLQHLSQQGLLPPTAPYALILLTTRTLSLFPKHIICGDCKTVVHFQLGRGEEEENFKKEKTSLLNCNGALGLWGLQTHNHMLSRKDGASLLQRELDFT